jgi:hypothetical protein
MMSDEYLQTDEFMNYTDQSTTIVILIDPARQPVELQDGLLKVIAYAPHGNLVTENAMDDKEDSSEFKWHVR